MTQQHHPVDEPPTTPSHEHTAPAAGSWRPGTRGLGRSGTDVARDTDLALVWKWRGRDDMSAAITTQHQLEVWTAQLECGGFGVLAFADGRGRWAQTMCDGSDWVVEAHDGTRDGWAMRVVIDELEAGQAPIDRFHAIDAAAIMWIWMHGALPERGRLLPLRVTGSGTSAGGVEWVTSSPDGLTESP